VSGFIATTTVTILRGEETDGYGDPVDSNVPVRARVPASIIERDQRVFVPAENRTTIVKQHTGRVRANVDIRTGDRLRDEKDQSIYLVEGVSRPRSPIGGGTVRLVLRRVDD